MDLASLIAYYRKRHMLSLKETAVRFGMSEKTLTHLETHHSTSKRSEQKAMTAMGVASFDGETSAEISAQLRQFFHAILYVDYEEAARLHASLERWHLAMSVFTPTWAVYEYMYAIHTQTSELDIEAIDHECQLLLPWMSDQEKELYKMEKAGYYFLKGDLSRSIETGLNSIQTTNDEHLKAINLFLLGASGINEVGKIETSMQYLEEAERLFLGVANYKRAIRCQAFELIGLVHAHRYDEVLPHYHTLKAQPVEDNNPAQLEAFIDGTLARFHLMRGDFETGLQLLNTIPFKSSTNYFLEMVALYQINDLEGLASHLHAHRQWNEPINNRVHLALMDALSAWLEERDVQRLSQALDQVFNLALTSGDYISIMLISPMATEALKNAKQYKRSYHLALETLNILRANT